MSNEEYGMAEEAREVSPPPFVPPPIPAPRFVPSHVVERPKKNHGCLYGCLIVAALMVLIAVVAIVALYGFVKQARDEFTNTAPIALPVVEAAPATREALAQRVETFKKALQNKLPAPPLVLSEKDLNILIQHNPDWENIKDKVYISIHDNKIGGIVSIPLGVFGVPFLEGRYLNGSAEFSVFVRDGVLHVYLRSLEVKGKSLPEGALQALRAKNLADRAQNDVQVRGLLEAIENIEIKDGALIIVPKITESEGSTYVRET